MPKFLCLRAKRHREASKAESKQSALTSPVNLQATHNMEPCRLLLLPKELRLEIWSYVLTDLFPHTLCIRRDRGQHFYNSLPGKGSAQVPRVITSLETRRESPINLHLLRTNHFIYHETLPILYHSIMFYPCDLEGIFPLFLDSLSPFAQSHIRYVKIAVPSSCEWSSCYFYWALTCAQIARLNGSLRRVDIEGGWPLSEIYRKRRNFLHPLLKIKAPKNFFPAHDAEFQLLLAEATAALDENAPLRKALTEADALQRAERDKLRPAKFDESSKKRSRQDSFTCQEDYVPDLLLLPVSESRIAEDLSTIAGIKNFQNDLEQWDMVEAQSENENESAPLAPRKRRAGVLDDDSWTDAASTIVVKEDEHNNTKGNDWEVVDHPID